MQELEKILEEIQELRGKAGSECTSEDHYIKKAWELCLDQVAEIIRKHMAGKDTNVRTNESWIPVEEALPRSRISRKGETQLKEKVIIYKNPNGDTRTAPKGITFEQFQEANNSHISDVGNVMFKISDMIKDNGCKHDWTKKSEEKMFYGDFIETMAGSLDFISGNWYQLHVNTERHHLLSRCPEDVNLLDVIEMIVDCVCAGKTRSEEIRGLEITTEILDKAMKNTVKLVDDMTIVR